MGDDVGVVKDALRALPGAVGAGDERVYLVLIQDSGELRPTGGFIGNYGVVRLSHGRLASRRFGDTEDLDVPYYRSGRSGPPVAMFARYFSDSTWWAIRDSNLWPDFPTSARKAAYFAIEEGAAERIDGVIGITPALAERLLRAFGPIVVPQVGETITADNFMERIRYYQRPAGQTALVERFGPEFATTKKPFTALLLQAMTEKLNPLDPRVDARLLPLLRDAVREKELALYFEDPRLERFMEWMGSAGEMKRTAGDYLWLVDMNLSAAKDNLYVRQTVQYTVTIQPGERSLAELAVTYDYRPGNLWQGSIKRGYYADYLRAYVPMGSVLVGSDGFDEPVGTFFERDKTVFDSFLKILPDTTRTVVFRYRLPLNAVRAEAAGTYDLLIQKQPATNVARVDVRVVLPDGSQVGRTDGLAANGSALEYHGPLAHDLALRGAYTLP